MRRLLPAASLLLLTLASGFAVGCDSEAPDRPTLLGVWLGGGGDEDGSLRYSSDGRYEVWVAGSPVEYGTFEIHPLGEEAPFGESAFAVTYSTTFGPERPDAEARLPSYNLLRIRTGDVVREYVRAP